MKESKTKGEKLFIDNCCNFLFLVQLREAERMNCTEMKNLPLNLRAPVNGRKTVHHIYGLCLWFANEIQRIRYVFTM
jgi:hypothetical protein